MSPTSQPPARTGSSIALVILCGCVIALLSFGPRSAMGLLFQPMTEARDWTREIFALALAIQNLVWGAAQPFAGMMADRYGTWRTLSLGAVLYFIGLILMANAESPMALHLSAGVLVGLGIAFSSFSLVLAAFGRRVTPAQRSLAFGIGTASGSVGQFVFAPLGQFLIETTGWQQTLVVFAFMMLAIPMLAVALKGRAAAHTGPIHTDQSLKQAIAEAFGTRGYILLTSGFFVCGFQLGFITVHLPPYISDQGLDPAWGASALALIGLCNIVGSLASGYIGGRYSKPIFLSLIYLARGGIIALFVILPTSPLTVLLFGASMGLLWLSTVPPTSGLVAVMFGPRYMATLFGFVFFSHQVGSFLGVWLGGLLYDQTNSYDVVWWIAAALGVFAAVVHWPIDERPVPRLTAEAAE